ncbi:MAG: hypothetical protein ACI350_04285 [Prevotella sp.]
MKRFFVVIFASCITLNIYSQSGTNSPYSHYGLGILNDQSNGFSRGMNGLGIGFHEHNHVNVLNPASYSEIDSLSFIFDMGLSGQITNFEENGRKLNANNSNFEYAVAGLRAARHLGVSFGILPYSNVGYNYATTQKINSNISTTSDTKYTNTHSGSGGFHQVFLGMGWQPIKGFAVGANISYFWGSYDKSLVNSYSDSYVNTLSKFYSVTVNNYKLDLGLQYTTALSKKDELTIGFTYGHGHKLGSDPECKTISTNSQTGVSDTATYVAKDGLELPTSYGAGLMWNHREKWKIGIDYTFQKWSSVSYPVYEVVNEIPAYTISKEMFNDRHKITFGGEFCPNEKGRGFFQRIHYRAGAAYTTPYLKINGIDGPKEYSVSAGFGIPIINTYNNRSLLNISAQWTCQDSKTFIKENTFRINIGLTFNERWFAKWKMQ